MIVVTGLSAGTAIADTRPVNARQAVDADVVVTVKNINGEVVIEGWGEKQLEVTGTMTGDVEEVVVNGTASRMRVEARFPENQRQTTGSADLRLKVPFDASVRVHVVNADITVGQVKGDVDLEAVNGDIDVRGESDQVTVKTVNGDIVVQAATERLEAETVGGRIRITGASGDVSAASVGGDVEVIGEKLSRARFTTVSGSIDVQAGFAGNATLNADGHSGVITLRMPADVSAEFEIRSFSGDIHNEFGPQPSKKTYGPGRELAFSTGRGDARVSINTFSGDVNLTRK
jgi:DUF4097 and DUF4098 domain-containing protein YvlB